MNTPDDATHTLRVVLAEDHAIVRSALKVLLAQVPGVQIVGEAVDGDELVKLVAALEPDVVLTDITMPRVDGITATASITRSHPGTRVVILSMHDSADVVKQSVAAGACGYIMKDAPAFELAHALRAVMETGRYFSPAVTSLLLQPSEPSVEDDLTPRQIEILKLLVRGMGSAQIGRKLGLSPKTVDVHRGRIMERLEVHDLASLTLYAVRKGLIKP